MKLKLQNGTKDNDYLIIYILKHLRQFVQSDWFLPVFISHDRDTARAVLLECFMRMHLALD